MHAAAALALLGVLGTARGLIGLVTLVAGGEVARAGGGGQSGDHGPTVRGVSRAVRSFVRERAAQIDGVKRVVGGGGATGQKRKPAPRRSDEAAGSFFAQTSYSQMALTYRRRRGAARTGRCQTS